MRMGCLSYLIPGRGIEEQWKTAAGLGLDCLEFLVLPDTDFSAFSREAEEAVRTHRLSICCLIGGQNFLDRANLPWFEGFVHLAATLDAVALITPEYAGHNPPAGIPPLPPPPEPELSRVKDGLKHLAAHAERANARLAIEAINRYETRFARTLDETLALAAGAGPEVGVVADFFHMNIEESDIASSIRRAGTRLFHVHLADNNRLLPGFGHQDLRVGLRALKAMSYSHVLSFECGIPNNDLSCLGTTVRRVRDAWLEA